MGQYLRTPEFSLKLPWTFGAGNVVPSIGGFNGLYFTVQRNSATCGGKKER